MADSATTGSNTQDLNQLLGQSPFGPLLDIQKADDGSKVTAQDIFANVGAGGNNAFTGGGGASFNQDSPYGGNPFAGDNFWNTFAGGVNPSNISGNAPSGGGSPSGSPVSSAGGGFPSGGNSGSPVSSAGGGFPSGSPSGSPVSSGGGSPSGSPVSSAGGNAGSPSPTSGENNQDLTALLNQSPFAPLLDIQKADGSKLTGEDIFANVNLPASSSPLGNGGDPFAGDNFWNTFAGGVNPTTFSSSSIPASTGNIPQGLPTGGSSTPVPEPSSVIGLAVIGVGIAATKFRQYQRRAVKVFNK